MLKTTILPKKSIFEKLEISDGKINRFSISSDKKLARKLGKLKNQKLFKSKKSKSKKLAKSKK